MMSVQELRKGIVEATAANEAIVSACEREHRQLTAAEKQTFNLNQRAAEEGERRLRELDRRNTITRIDPQQLMGVSQPSPDPTRVQGSKIAFPRRTLTHEYVADFGTFLRSRGKVIGPELASCMDELGGFPLFGYAPRPEMGATLYEGAPGAGGYAVPITVDDQIVPLAPQEMSVRRLAMVIPTTMDIKIPTKAAFGTATTVAELGTFGGNPVSLNQFTLSAFMVGSQEQISWELAQDVPAFQAFVVDDMILAQQMEEEPLYLTGTGSGQPQGLIGNVGAGVTEEPDANSNLVSISGILDLIGTLNAMYHPNASFLMSRPTSIILRKAQVEQNLFFPAFSRDANGQDRLFGYPVEYSGFMPAAARGNAPVLFGDFKRGYIIGDRGGSGINVKVLDQPLATQGILVLLAYRRTDGRVRRSEAIQQYNIALS